jgi:hypothetical protein
MSKSKTKVIAAPVSAFLIRATRIWFFTNFFLTISLVLSSFILPSFSLSLETIPFIAVFGGFFSALTIPALSGTFHGLNTTTMQEESKRYIMICLAILLAILYLYVFASILAEVADVTTQEEEEKSYFLELLPAFTIAASMATLLCTWNYPSLERTPSNDTTPTS